MRALTIFLCACLVAAFVPLREPRADVCVKGFPGWPASFEGRALCEEPLLPIEQRAVRSFPGRIGKFTDGQRQILLRWVNRPSRSLHSAEVCFRGLGYRVVPGPLTRDNEGTLWSTFKAERGKERLAVRTLIRDERGHTWQDVSGWFWAAALGRSSSPWWSITVIDRGHRDGSRTEQ